MPNGPNPIPTARLPSNRSAQRTGRTPENHFASAAFPTFILLGELMKVPVRAFIRGNFWAGPAFARIPLLKRIAAIDFYSASGHLENCRSLFFIGRFIILREPGKHSQMQINRDFQQLHQLHLWQVFQTGATTCNSIYPCLASLVSAFSASLSSLGKSGHGISD